MSECCVHLRDPVGLKAQLIIKVRKNYLTTKGTNNQLYIVLKRAAMNYKNTPMTNVDRIRKMYSAYTYCPDI